MTARAKILRLPEVAQQLVGSGEIAVSAIDTLLAIGAVSPAVAQAVSDAIAAQKIAGSQLQGNAGWVIGQALRDAGKDTFGQYLNHVHHDELKGLRLGKKADAMVAEAEQLHRQLDRYAYGPPTIRFSETDVDQARAAGVLLELERSTPIICDRPLYRELCKQAIARTAEDLKARVADKAAGKRAGGGARERTPREQLDSEHRANVREIARQAHGTNLDLGAALLTQLATVPADDMDVARFFAYGLLGPDGAQYAGAGDNVARAIAANGLRLVLEEHRTTETPTLKSGARGKTKVAYCEPDVAAKWLWRFVDGAKTAGELYGRAMVVFAAEHYASQLILATSKRRASVLPRSHKDTARKAFERVTKGVLPASHTQLQRAIAAEARAYERSIAQVDSRERPAASQPATGESVVDDDHLGEGPDPDDDLDMEDRGD